MVCTEAENVFTLIDKENYASLYLLMEKLNVTVMNIASLSLTKLVDRGNEFNIALERNYFINHA